MREFRDRGSGVRGRVSGVRHGLLAITDTVTVLRAERPRLLRKPFLGGWMGASVEARPGTDSPGRSPVLAEGQLTLTSIWRGFVSGRFGRVTVRTPSRYEAVIWPAST